MDKMGSLQTMLWLLMTNKSDHNNSNNSNHFLMTLLIIIIPYITKIIPFPALHDALYDYWTKDTSYVTINIPSHQIPILRGSSSVPLTKLVYSKAFISIINYISNNKKIGFVSMTEVMTSNTELSNQYYDNDNKVKDNYLMLPIHSERILICEKKQIYFQLKDFLEKEDTENKTNSTTAATIKNKQFMIILSKKKDNYAINDINDFIQDCITEHDSHENIKLQDKRQYIYEYKGSEKEDDTILILKYNEHLMEHNKDLTTNIFFEEKDKLIQYIKPFVYDENIPVNQGEEKYKKSGFTFKAGLLFYGFPGCGKTSTIKAILKYTNRHGILINLSKIKTCEELENIFRNRTINGRDLSGKQLCFILEDCDAFENNIIKSRELNEETKIDDLLKKNDDYVSISKVLNLTKPDPKSWFQDDDKVNLSCFLNILDGIIELHGIMIIMTTNYPDKIDYALIRPGRFDFKYEFKRATKNTIMEMLKFKFELSDAQSEKCRDLLTIKDEILSPAEIQSVCFKNTNVYDAINELILLAQK